MGIGHAVTFRQCESQAFLEPDLRVEAKFALRREGVKGVIVLEKREAAPRERRLASQQ